MRVSNIKGLLIKRSKSELDRYGCAPDFDSLNWPVPSKVDLNDRRLPKSNFAVLCHCLKSFRIPPAPHTNATFVTTSPALVSFLILMLIMALATPRHRRSRHPSSSPLHFDILPLKMPRFSLYYCAFLSLVNSISAACLVYYPPFQSLLNFV
ncbi:hypothetical protein K438DRAFT_1830275 [Mycena galopus ATCC 62051]|nr:hypothetical protein K438DRAFT_1830275 [Mycena galopus ATCC 62051]